MVHIQNPPEVLNGLRSLLVIHGQHKLQKSFIIHLSHHCGVLLKDTIDDDI